MRILSIDPSLSSCGYAIIDSFNRSIVKINRITTSQKDGDENQRIYIITKEIENIIKNDNEIQEITLEDGFVKFAGSSLKLGKLRGALIFNAQNIGIKVYSQEPTETRKNLGLKGNAKKEDVAAKILELYPNLLEDIGEYSDKPGKNKTSDMYDAVCIGIAHLNKTSNVS